MFLPSGPFGDGSRRFSKGFQDDIQLFTRNTYSTVTLAWTRSFDVVGSPRLKDDERSPAFSTPQGIGVPIHGVSYICMFCLRKHTTLDKLHPALRPVSVLTVRFSMAGPFTLQVLI